MIPSVNPIGGWIVSPSLSKIDRARRLRTQERRVYIIWKSSDYKVQGQQRKGHPIDVIYEKGQTKKPSSSRPNKEHSGAQIVGSGEESIMMKANRSNRSPPFITHVFSSYS